MNDDRLVFSTQEIRKMDSNTFLMSSVSSSASQIHKVHSLVSMVLSEAMKDGLITSNPTERVRLPKFEKNFAQIPP